MPFKSNAQRKKLYLLRSEGKLPGVNLHEWAAKTDQKSLPEHVKKSEAFQKRSGAIAGYLKQYFFKKKDAKKDVEPERLKPDSPVEARREEELKAAYARGMVEYLVEAGEDPAPILKAAGLI